MRWNYYKLRQLSLLQSAMDCYYKLRQLFYYKVRQGLLQIGKVLQSAMDLLQIATDITKCDDYYKLRQYKRLERRTCNSEVPSSSPILTASWIGFR